MVELENKVVTNTDELFLTAFFNALALAPTLWLTAKGKFRALHPITAFIGLLNGIGNQLCDAERIEYAKSWLADNPTATQADADAEARKAIVPTLENDRVALRVLERLHSKNKTNKVRLSDSMVKRGISLAKKAANFKGDVSPLCFQELVNRMSAYTAENFKQVGDSKLGIKKLDIVLTVPASKSVGVIGYTAENANTPVPAQELLDAGIAENVTA